MDMSIAIPELLLREAITQAELARRANISQTTVSRAINRTPQRRGKAYLSLVAYMQQHPPPSPTEAVRAVSDVWDGSPAHEKALANLVVASRELWPNLREE